MDGTVLRSEELNERKEIQFEMKETSFISSSMHSKSNFQFEAKRNQSIKFRLMCDQSKTFKEIFKCYLDEKKMNLKKTSR